MLNDAEKKINERLSEIEEQLTEIKSNLAAEKSAILSRMSLIEHKMKENQYQSIQHFHIADFAIAMETASKKIGELIEEKRFLENLL